ncbi:hypothetical protein ACNOYE_12895 [Nannocystaceae bacterium ST9]
MQLINHTDTFRKNLLVGLAVGTGAVATGCGTPEPASLENANRGEVDKLDYANLDYSKVEMMGEYCDPTFVPGKELGIEMVARLDKAIEVAQAKQLDKAVVTTLVNERKYVVAGNAVFEQYADVLCW